MSGLGVVLIIGGTALFWAVARSSHKRDLDRLERQLPPNKRHLVTGPARLPTSSRKR